MSPSVSRITRNPVRTRVWSSARSTRIFADIPTILQVPLLTARSSLRTTPGCNVILAPDDGYRAGFLRSRYRLQPLERKTNERHLQGNPATGLCAGRPGYRGRGVPDVREHHLP